MSRIVQIPIFPLASSILFPGIYIPFHIFEERYKAMLREVNSKNLHLAVSYAPELQPTHFYPHMICGAGPVRVLKENANGESDILVFGQERVRFTRYVQEIPFLIGEGEILVTDAEMPKSTHDTLLVEIKDMLISWIFSYFDESMRAINFFKNVTDLEPLCNFVCYYFIEDMDKKQNLLEEDNLEFRAQAVWQILKDLAQTGTKGPASPPLIFPGSEGDDSPSGSSGDN